MSAKILLLIIILVAGTCGQLYRQTTGAPFITLLEKPTDGTKKCN